jgi:HEPN domain-containing protein
MLRALSIEYTKTHDPGKILEANKERLPEWLKGELDYLTYTSRWLRAEREPSMYGDEAEGIPPDKLYNEAYCAKALEAAERVYSLAERLLRELQERS